LERSTQLAEFLNTSGVTFHLEQLLQSTRERLILISPYLQFNDRIKLILEDRDRFKVDIHLVFRENQLNPAEQNWLRGVPSIRTSFCENLHAKCYLNENEAVITSMNLYQFSQVNNYEMGIYVTREEDRSLFEKIYEEAKTILRASKEIRITVAEVPETPRAAKGDAKAEKGFCIRCHAGVKLNPMVPYCRDCYAQWKKSKSGDSHAEQYCHICGKANASSLNKPVCRDCYKANKNTLEFPLAPGK